MNLKKLAAAAALVATGAANAAIDGGLTSNNGSMFLIGFDKTGGTTTSAIFDLGYLLNDVIGATGNGSTTSVFGTIGAPGNQVVWDFVNNTVSLNGTQVTTLGTNDWSGAYQRLLDNSDAAEIQWVMGAQDASGVGAARRYLATGSLNATATQLANQNSSSTTNFAQISNTNDIFTPVNTRGTNATADNGAYTFIAADGAANRLNGFVMAGDGFGNNWRNFNVLLGTADVNQTHGLWALDGSGAERLIGEVLFSIDTGTLTLTTTPVPEPETYAMMGLGLVGVALAARRRRA